mmetsp:Transcript_20080/g.17184  ORF Transcript_20080/g.17184 Transcript_20080/m.17184 type:complete len:475 (+) Transcript_20080:571-1995(+)
MVLVWRDGKPEPQEIHQSEIVTGDIIKLDDGMDVPADIICIESNELQCDESAMTGEPDHIKKRLYNECLEKRDQIMNEGSKNNAGRHDVPSPILLSGTQVAGGFGKGIVLVVGPDSCVGRIKDLVTQDDAQATPLQQKLETIARDIGKFGLISATITFVVLIIRFIVDRATTDSWDDGGKWLELIDYFIIAVTVVVVAIPEGLPLAVTLSLAFSVKKMLKDKNLVRKLNATETMGGANNICSDKTGTLTKNEMDLTGFWNCEYQEINVHNKNYDLAQMFGTDRVAIMEQALGVNGNAEILDKKEEKKEEEKKKKGCLCFGGGEDEFAELKKTKDKTENGSKTEIALLKFLFKADLDYRQLRKKYAPQNEKELITVPFSSKRKRMSTVCCNVNDLGNTTGKRMHLKGASEIITASCDKFYSFEKSEVVPIDEDMKKSINDAIENMARKALRTIGIAYKDVTGDEDFSTKDSNDVC